MRLQLFFFIVIIRLTAVPLLLACSWYQPHGLVGDLCLLGQQPNDPDQEQSLVGYWPKVDEPREIILPEASRLATGPFTITLWAKSDELSSTLTGDLVSQYDPQRRRGFHLTVKTNAGVTSSQPNWRHLQFGIDDNRTSPWQDCGRPGSTVLVFSMAVHNGHLYVGTCEPGKDHSGHVYRYAGRQDWIDCGSPDNSNTVTSLAVYQGALYAATGKYRLAGSSLPESENAAIGGRIFRYEGQTRWTYCGQLPNTEAVGGMVVFRGKLYASSLYSPPGFFRYEGGTVWTALPVPIGPDRQTQALGPRRVESLTVYNGFLYASSYDGGRVYRFDGHTWTDCGQVGENTQTYAFAVYKGHLHVATWPSGRVYRFKDVGQWEDTGRLGNELEVMGMVVHNGRLLAGTLPLAEVYQYDGDGLWTRLARLDHTPNVKYRRVWTMAEHDGQLFCSTLPSGHVFSFSAGRQIQTSCSLSSEWHHIAAVRYPSRLVLYLDGIQVAQSPEFDGDSYCLDTPAPLMLGTGFNAPFHGTVRDLRLYRCALDAKVIATLANRRPQDGD